MALLLIPALAWAQPKSAEDWYKEGENQYNLGNFEKAVDAFKQGFALETNESKKAAYLFNVAQSYRQANDCKNAQFFYKRFLALKNTDTVKPLSPKTRNDIEDRISELEACVQQQAQISKKPPDNLRPDSDAGDHAQPAGGDAGHKDGGRAKNVAVASPSTGGDEPADTPEVPAHPSEAPHLISARITGGVTKLGTGGSPIDVPAQASLALVAGYPIAVNDQLTIEAGAAVTFSPVPFETPNKTGKLWGLLANAAATYEVIPRLGVRVDVGLGALFASNFGESPFTGGQATSGALTMFHFRGALSGDYRVTPNVVLTLTPIAFTYSPPKDGLIDDIKSITSVDFLVGVGYRM